MFDIDIRKSRSIPFRTFRSNLELQLLFWKRCLLAPKQVSMLLQSSPAVGRTMVDLVRERPMPGIVELGAGTGAITRQLVAARTDALTCIELDSQFVAHLRRIWPDLDVLCIPAQKLGAVWRERGSGHVGAILSSLPIRLFSDDEQNEILNAALSVLGPGGHLVQLTYRPTNPVSPAALPAQLSVIRRRVVWANVPPAFLWVYRRSE